MCDRNGVIRAWNQACQWWTGIEVETAVGQPLDELLMMAGEFETLKAAAVGPGQVSAPHAWLVHRREGDPLPTRRVVACVVADADESAPGPFYLCTAWPEVHRGEAHPSPGASLEEVGTIASHIASAFGNIIAPVLGSITLLEEELVGGQHVQRRLASIRQAAETARAFGQRLVALDPKRRLNQQVVDPARLLREISPGLSAVLRPEVELRLSSPANLDSVRVDRRQVEHALLELVRNAQEAISGKGAISVELATIEREDPGSGSSSRWVALRVRDNGRGMEPAILEHAFQPFITTKMPGSGAGLGLAVVSAVAQQHGGLVEAESRLGAGAAFSMLFPSAGSAETARAAAAVSSQTGTAAPSKASGEVILLVEDNAMVRRSIDATLRGLGYRVIAVEGGEQCIANLKAIRDRVDLLVTDVVMPEMSGKELIERVHQLRPTLPVLFMSGYDLSSLTTRKQSMVAEHFLQKPFDSEDLAAAVRKAMGAAGSGQPSS